MELGDEDELEAIEDQIQENTDKTKVAKKEKTATERTLKGQQYRAVLERF